MTDTDITFRGEGAWTTWAREWCGEFLERLRGSVDVTGMTVHNSGNKQIRIDMTTRGRSTVCLLNVAQLTDARDRADVTAQWYDDPRQQAHFDQADAGLGRNTEVERAAALAVATRVSGAVFENAVLRYQGETKAQVKSGKPNIQGMHRVMEIDTALGLRRREDGTPAVRLRARDFIMTDVTFTPRITAELPLSVLLAMRGRKLDTMVDTPAIAGGGLIIRDARSNGNTVGQTREPTISFEVVSDRMTLDDAVELIDERRSRASWTSQED